MSSPLSCDYMFNNTKNQAFQLLKAVVTKYIRAQVILSAPKDRLEGHVISFHSSANQHTRFEHKYNKFQHNYNVREESEPDVSNKVAVGSNVTLVADVLHVSFLRPSP
jgi:hypothetical protein